MDLTNISVGVALAYSVLGFAIVFLGLILLMIVIAIMARVMKAGQTKAAAVAAAEAPAAPAAAPAPKAVAPGTAGEIKLHTVSDRDAAMIMAIVAHKMNRPLNELRFKSIKEVK